MPTSSASSPSSGPEAGPAVRVAGLVKRYGGRRVLAGIDLTVARGEVLALLGPNGAGKTTLVEIVEGYRRADAGEVEVLGRDPWRAGPHHRARIGLMLQEGGVDPRARPLEVLRLFAALYAAPRDPLEVLREVGLRDAAGTRYRQLSGGEKQRLALGLALIGRPELLILDEPTAGMDPAARASTRALIAGLRRSGATILVTTHDLTDVERLADRVAILDRGRIAELGAPGDLTAGDPGIVRIRLAAPVIEADLDRLRRAMGTGQSGARPAHGLAGAVVVEAEAPGETDRLRIAVTELSPEVIAALAAAFAAAGLRIAELRTTGGSLEDRYMELTGDGAVEGGSGRGPMS